MAGAFRVYEFNVIGTIRPGEANALAVEVLPERSLINQDSGAIAGGITQVPQADCVLTYHRNAPVVAAGTLFYGGVNAADWCNSFSYQMILAEFEVDGATLDSFSYNTATVDNSGDPLSVTGRLPSDNP